MRFPEVGDERAGECLVQFGAHLVHPRSVRRKAEEEPLGGAAAGLHQFGAVQAFAGEHGAWAYVEAAGHAVGLESYDARDTELLTAEANEVTHAGFEAHHEVFGNRDGVGA